MPENDAPAADVGDAAHVTLRAIPGKVFEGKIDRIARGLDPSTRTMLVEIDLPNPDRRLLPGMYGETTIDLDQKPDALTLPAGTVRYDQKGQAFVYVVDDQNQVQIVNITTGLDDGNRIEISDGLKGSERVVAPMIDRLSSGQTVRVQSE